MPYFSFQPILSFYQQCLNHMPIFYFNKLFDEENYQNQVNTGILFQNCYYHKFIYLKYTNSKKDVIII